MNTDELKKKVMDYESSKQAQENLNNLQGIVQRLLGEVRGKTLDLFNEVAMSIASLLEGYEVNGEKIHFIAPGSFYCPESRWIYDFELQDGDKLKITIFESKEGKTRFKTVIYNLQTKEAHLKRVVE